jgi:hypothetical protein
MRKQRTYRRRMNTGNNLFSEILWWTNAPSVTNSPMCDHAWVTNSPLCDHAWDWPICSTPIYLTEGSNFLLMVGYVVDWGGFDNFTRKKKWYSIKHIARLVCHSVNISTALRITIKLIESIKIPQGYVLFATWYPPS